jgi:hypothetical protein
MFQSMHSKWLGMFYSNKRDLGLEICNLLHEGLYREDKC